MKRITVTPLKEVNGVRFGETRASVRKEFGKYKEFKKHKNSADDFGWCHVFYDANGKMEAVEIFTAEARIVIGSTQVDTSSMEKVKKSLGIKDSTDKSKSIGVTESNEKISAILFGKRGYYDDSKDTEKSEAKTEAACPECEDEKKEDPKKPEQQTSTQKKEEPIKKEAAGTDLTQFYDDLKNQLNSNPAGAPPAGMMRVGPANPLGLPTPGAQAFRQKANIECDKLKDKCCKHLILDIYCKVLPLDSEFILGHRGELSADVDGMLASKGMSPSQYLTSCSEKTKAPLLEFVNRSVDNIGKAFLMEAKEKLDDAQEQDIDVPAPEAPDPEEDEEVSSQLVDVKKDTEYENFIDKLKEKTIKKIVSDVSKIISNKKEENEMTFDPQPDAGNADAGAEEIPADTEPPALESTTAVGIDFLQAKFMREGVDVTPELQENMIGMAIREATLNEINACFRQPDTDLRPFASRVRMGRGYVINESTAMNLLDIDH